MDFTKLLDSLNLNISTPAIRNIALLKAAKEEYDNENFLNSIFYQVEALGLGARAKYFNNQLSAQQIKMPLMKNIEKNLDFAGKCSFKNLEKYVQNGSNGDSISLEKSFSSDPERGIERIMKVCSNLPEEWTILQLCKTYCPETSILTAMEIVTYNQPIYLTILHHPRSLQFPEPICIKIEETNDPDNIFEIFQCVIRKANKAFIGKEGILDRQEKMKFWKDVESVEKDIDKAISELKRFIGPWACFFAGNTLEDNKQTQDELFAHVDKFCKKHKFNNTVIVVLSLLARQIHLLNEPDIIAASSYLTTLTRSNANRKTFNQFFRELKDSNQYAIKCYPCIIIVDELLDDIFWEMVNTEQEICRMSSLYTLERVFEQHKNKIHKGYIHFKIDKGSSIINPDGNLPNMQKRMTSFFSYWLPKWKCYTGEVPTSEFLMDEIVSNDVFLYSGHGSGLQYIQGLKITKLNTNSVIFLLGCDSVRVKSNGLHSEMVGAHIFYHAALSPAVIGCLFVALDSQLDTLSTNIISTWIPSTQSKHWSLIDQNTWKKKGQLQFLSKGSQSYEPRLSKILSNIRSQIDEKSNIRPLLVLRGLPVWNVNASEKHT